MTEEALSAFVRVKDMVMTHTTRVLMNDSDPLILCTGASTRAVGGVLMKVQGGRERPCVFVSHAVRASDEMGGGDGTRTVRFRILHEES